MNTISLNHWETEEKAICFETIATEYYNRNFGKLSKSDLEVLMFSLLLEHCRKNGIDESDYTLAVQLGITENRVRTLKVKKELQYPNERYNWKHLFMKSIANGRYDETRKLIILSISDPNVKREVEHLIEVKGWYHESQLNTKLLQMPVDQFIGLCEQLSSEIEGHDISFNQEEFIERIRKSPSADLLKEKGLWEKYKDADIRVALPAILRECGKDSVKIALDCFPLPSFAKESMKLLIDKL